MNNPFAPYCINGDGNPIENRTTQECASCGKERRKLDKVTPKAPPKPIRKVSAKQQAALALYGPKRDRFLRGKRCAVHPHEPATDVHHMAGRGFDFIDQWAEERGIIRLLDERYWLPVSREGHAWIELHPKEAKAKGWSVDRLTNKFK